MNKINPFSNNQPNNLNNLNISNVANDNIKQKKTIYNQTSTTKTYWCHLCKKEFSKLYIENTEVHCRLCGKTFCEEITSEEEEEHPSNYQPFEQSTRGFNNILNGSSNNNNGNSRSSSFREASRMLDILSSLLTFNEDSHMENIINYLMANDPNKYGNPPASKEEVEKLEKIIINCEDIRKEINSVCGEGGCSVCKDDYEMDQTVIKLPCCHMFHDDCIMPWLKERNSCPTCRFELKTDDSDYEERKNIKRDEVRHTVSSNNLGIINNSSSNLNNNQEEDFEAPPLPS